MSLAEANPLNFFSHGYDSVSGDHLAYSLEDLYFLQRFLEVSLRSLELFAYFLSAQRQRDFYLHALVLLLVKAYCFYLVFDSSMHSYVFRSFLPHDPLVPSRSRGILSTLMTLLLPLLLLLFFLFFLLFFFFTQKPPSAFTFVLCCCFVTH